jgi:S1-C subfamily serine protease
MNKLKTPLAILLATVAVVVGAGFASSQTTTSAQSGSVAGSLENAFSAVYKKVSPSVVQISTSEGLGSGIVFDSAGNIVTNAHVVGTSTTFTVTTSTGKRLTGKLVGVFQPDDLAVIKVNGAGLRPASFADSNTVRIGDISMAIGNPLGLSSSFTEGIVSALNRSEPEGNGVTLPNAIQTSAPINPGNSGGALTNIHGAVIGIPTLAAADPQMGGAAAGIGFAIPSNVVVNIARQLVKTGKVTNSNRAYLGVQIADTAAANGVVITQVITGTAADKAGLVAGDRITAVDTTKTPTSTQLSTALAGFKPGQTIKVTVAHQSGASATLSLTLGQYPSGNG